MKKNKKILSLIMAIALILSSSLFNVVEAATGQNVVGYARKFIGTPYVWGGTTPQGFDCSGFVQYVYRNSAGIELPRTTYDQINAGTRVSRNQLQPGDLVFPHTGHVGIYVGDGKMIHAPHTGDVVKISPISKFYAGVRISGITTCPYVEPASGDAKPIKKLYMLLTDAQYVKSAPCDEASIVRTLKHGEVVDIYKEYGEWSLIARGANQQWIRSGYLAPRVPVVDDGNARPIKKLYQVIASSVQVRSYPSSSSQVVRTLNNGELVDIYAEHGDWCLIARGVSQQWVPKNSLCPYVHPVSGDAKPIKKLYMLVTDSQVVRGAPCDKSAIVRTLKHGDVVDIYKEYGEWSLIARGDSQQWIRSSYLAPRVPVVDNGNERPIKKSYKVIVTSAQVRSYPSNSSAVVRTLKHGDSVDIYAEHGDWYLVARGTSQQWVLKNYLSN